MVSNLTAIRLSFERATIEPSIRPKYSKPLPFFSLQINLNLNNNNNNNNNKSKYFMFVSFCEKF